MAKVKVHELAKELNIQSKEILHYLSEQNIEIKSHMSSVEDDIIAIVKKKFSQKEMSSQEGPKKAEGKEQSAKESLKEEDKENSSPQERPKKKSSITAVYNPQNSKQPGNRRGNQNQGGNRNGRPQGSRVVRPQGERVVRPQGERPARPQGERPVRPQGERPTRPQGERPARPQGERSTRPQGDRPIRAQSGERPNERRARNGEENNRQDQNARSGNRTPSNYNQNGRNNGRVGQNRQKESRGKLDQEINKFNKNSVSSVEESNGKDRRDNRRNDKKNKGQNKDDFGNKRQERYINLEKNGGKKKKQPQPQPQEKKEESIKTIILPDSLTIKELAEKMKVQPAEIIKKLFLKGTMVTVNQDVDYDTAEEIALEFNCLAEHEVKVDVIEELLKEEDEDENKMVKRPPVVCVMGHVDHGKTSLLDAIRNTRVTDREAGGITQHIGAYMVEINGEKITFLDTPGHEAFTAMRMRGANSTDIAILVVAADDGVMPQTVEAINHAKAANTEIIVAVNKIDKPNANIEKVKQELAEYELIPEDWGGSTIFVPVSAHTHEGIDQLLEMILLTAEISELKANPKRQARGIVIEAQLDKGRGAVATILVQKGTLKVGQPVACGSSFGKVRAMIDDKGRNVKEAGPSTPVEILGLSSVPGAGEIFVAKENEKEARSFAETFISESKNRLIEETKSKMSLDDLFSQIQSGNVKELDIIVKADVQGSVEAVKQSLVKLSNEEVIVKVIHGGVGAINESDVSLASASNAIIIGFNVRPDTTAKAVADREGVDIRLYKIIYNAIEDVEAAMKGMLDPIFE
ncbi:MAG: translation initiation factor IF-2, partial [Lachnospiraceae bacterium]|nr:translation initiation factor IF-2 [Lachnospiraceae bacterium]